MQISKLCLCLQFARYPYTRPSPALPYLPAALIRRQMSSPARKVSVPHTVRTAAEPRQNRLFTVRLSHIEQANPTVRLLQLTIPASNVQDPEPESQREGFEGAGQLQPLTFLPGQWLDVYIPSVSNAGGFSITSTPADAQVLPSLEPTTEPISAEENGGPPMDPRGRDPYVELAVQNAPANPASAWLWKPKEEILGKDLSIRVGGSFVWPPSSMDLEKIRNVVFVAGGVGINPLISMLSHLNNNDETTILHHPSLNIRFLYSSKLPEASTPERALDQILFLPRLRQILRSQSQSHRLQITLDLFLTNLHDPPSPLLVQRPEDLTIHPRRINRDDLQRTIVGTDIQFTPQDTVCYVCGPPEMTDEVIKTLGELLDGRKEQIIFEKWW